MSRNSILPLRPLSYINLHPPFINHDHIEVPCSSRPLGLSEAYSAVQHSLKFACGYMVSAVFTHGNGQLDIPQAQLYAALKSVILEHPNLSVVLQPDHGHGHERKGGKKKKTMENVKFRMVDQMDLDELVIWLPRPKTLKEQANVHALYLSQEMKNVEHTPLWRVLVSPRLREPATCASAPVVDGTEIVVYYHKAIGDPKSGQIFLDSLLEALNTLDQQFSGPDGYLQMHRYSLDGNGSLPKKLTGLGIVRIPKSMILTKSIDQLLYTHTIINPVSSIRRLANKLLRRYKQPPLHEFWSGGPIVNNRNFSRFPQTNIEIIKVPAHKVQALVNECANQNVDLTNLVSALAVAALNSTLPDPMAEKLNYSIAHDLRQDMPEPMNVFADYSSFYEQICVDRSDLSAANTKELGLTARIWHTARDIRNEVNSEHNLLLHHHHHYHHAGGYHPTHYKRYSASTMRKHFAQALEGRQRLHALEISHLCIDHSSQLNPISGLQRQPTNHLSFTKTDCSHSHPEHPPNHLDLTHFNRQSVTHTRSSSSSHHPEPFLPTHLTHLNQLNHCNAGPIQIERPPEHPPNASSLQHAPPHSPIEPVNQVVINCAHFPAPSQPQPFLKKVSLHNRSVSAATDTTLTGPPGWSIAEYGFKQGASTEGAAIYVNCVSKAAGPGPGTSGGMGMAVSFVWANEAVCSELVRKVVGRFQETVDVVWREAGNGNDGSSKVVDGD